MGYGRTYRLSHLIVIWEKGIKGLYMNKDNIKNSALHDYELKKLEISYEHKCVLMHLISPTGIHDVLEMPHFKKCRASCEEPWGMGTYIVYSDLLCDTAENELAKFTLNSGDELEVIL